MAEGRKRWLSLLCGLGLVLALGALPAFAETGAPGEAAAPYTYTVRVYAGNHGSFPSEVEHPGYLEFTGNDYAGIAIDWNGIRDRLEMEDGKYYARGIRLSGRDNSEEAASLSGAAQANGDVDYVVAYGIAGDLVSYTVQYLGPNGEVLSPAQTFYGNVGDKPVVAYLDIPGWQPQALNITGTLHAESEGPNEFIFRYTPLVTYEDQEVVIDDGVIGGGGGGGAGGGAGGGGAGGAGGAGGDAGVDIGGNDTPLDNGPQQLVDIDDNDTPYDNGPSGLPEENTQSGRLVRMVGSATALAASLAALAVLVVVVLKRRKEREQEQQQ